jgi:hypothetical protein
VNFLIFSREKALLPPDAGLSRLGCLEPGCTGAKLPNNRAPASDNAGRDRPDAVEHRLNPIIPDKQNFSATGGKPIFQDFSLAATATFQIDLTRGGREPRAAACLAG